MNITLVFDFYFHLPRNRLGDVVGAFSQGLYHIVVQFSTLQQLLQGNAVTNRRCFPVLKVFIYGGGRFDENLLDPLDFPVNLLFAILQFFKGIIINQTEFMPYLH